MTKVGTGVRPKVTGISFSVGPVVRVLSKEGPLPKEEGRGKTVGGV